MLQLSPESRCENLMQVVYILPLCRQNLVFISIASKTLSLDNYFTSNLDGQ
jgi:hypothetical protein